MNTDKNTVIGFVLLAVLFFIYFWYTNKQQTEMAAYKKHFDDSVAMIKASAEKAVALQNSVPLDSTKVTSVTNIDTVKEEFTYLENDLVKVLKPCMYPFPWELSLSDAVPSGIVDIKRFLVIGYDGKLPDAT